MARENENILMELPHSFQKERIFSDKNAMKNGNSNSNEFLNLNEKPFHELYAVSNFSLGSQMSEARFSQISFLLQEEKKAQHLLHTPVEVFGKCLDQAILGFSRCESQMLALTDDRIITRSKKFLMDSKVKLISGGSWLMAACVGRGMLTCAAASNSVVPKPSVIFRALQYLKKNNRKAEIIAIIPNNIEDRISWGIALAKAQREEINVDHVFVADDSWDYLAGFGNRSLTGILFYYKIAGSMAEEKRPSREILDKLKGLNVASISCHFICDCFCRHALRPGSYHLDSRNIEKVDRTSSSKHHAHMYNSLEAEELSVFYIPTLKEEDKDTSIEGTQLSYANSHKSNYKSHEQDEKKEFKSKEYIEVCIGTDLTGEGGKTIQVKTLKELIKKMSSYLLDPVLMSSAAYEPDTKFIVMINLYNGKLCNLYHVTNLVMESLTSEGIEVVRLYVGHFIRSKEGFCISLLSEADNDIIRWLDDYTAANCWTVNGLGNEIKVKPVSKLQPLTAGPCVAEEDRPLVEKAIRAACQGLKKEESHLNDLDPMYGTRMATIANTLLEYFSSSEMPFVYPGLFLNEISELFADTFSDSKGLSMALFFISASLYFRRTSKEDIPVNIKMWMEAVYYGVKSVQSYSDLREGQGTPLDLLGPMSRVTVPEESDKLIKTLENILSDEMKKCSSKKPKTNSKKKMGFEEASKEATYIWLSSMLDAISEVLLKTEELTAEAATRLYYTGEYSYQSIVSAEESVETMKSVSTKSSICYFYINE